MTTYFCSQRQRKQSLENPVPELLCSRHCQHTSRSLSCYTENIHLFGSEETRREGDGEGQVNENHNGQRHGLKAHELAKYIPYFHSPVHVDTQADIFVATVRIEAIGAQK